MTSLIVIGLLGGTCNSYHRFLSQRETRVFDRIFELSFHMKIHVKDKGMMRYVTVVVGVISQPILEGFCSTLASNCTAYQMMSRTYCCYHIWGTYYGI
ncbi:hypothetical protein BJV74DRAFT_554277 [Russula compacta]|nr:hypothetical protein BJV74DRAFT_554277 [Russula compacta]